MSTISHMHKSSVSQHSRSITQFMNENEELTDAELIKSVQDLKQHIKILKLENEILERTIMRLEPSLMNGIQQALDYASKIATNSSSLAAISFVKSQTSRFTFETMQSPSRLLTSPSKVSTRRAESSARLGGTIFGSGPRINVLERSELVSTEMEILMNFLERIRKNAAKQHALLKAQLEEIGVRVADVDKSTEAFKQEVIIDGWDKIAQRIPAEIWIRFMTEWIKTTDSQIGKLRLRTSTLNTQYSKLKSQIRVKAELNESLRPVDFEKLKIENGECVETIEKKLQQLEELKKMTGDANLNLMIHKKAMMAQNQYLENILDTIKIKQKQTMALDKNTEVIKVQADSLAKRLEDIKKTRLAYEVPDIMDYVCVKSEVTDLVQSIKMLENRVHIQQIALASLNKKLRNMLA